MANVPTSQVSSLLQNVLLILGRRLEPSSLPARSTNERMALQLGTISDLQASQMLFNSSTVTLSFDSTTQEGVHVNKIHMTCSDNTYLLSIKQLPGGTASDYASHILRTEIMPALWENLDETLLLSMIRGILEGSAEVIQRQYQSFPRLSVEQQETMRTASEFACLHNIDAEKVMGMFSAALSQSPNATMMMISSRIKGRKNYVLNFLSDNENWSLLDKVSLFTTRLKRKSLADQKLLLREMSNRISAKKLKLEPAKENERLTWNEKIEGTELTGKRKIKKSRLNYTVSYWAIGATHETSVKDYSIPAVELAIDYMFKDLHFV
ncbi:hypothetical protein CAPTEDRAFT_194446 [Capitella teleta]|uniref:Uncharacterized protein n=1 Tax=Capitella teleta TaxID=283909 RepID=R7UJS1_CAPTE|nr:hypothetical protein CAPTEDRAFT_194446 [Capitella teleta]|eukprot:ELU06804.1 hypothetical protein CAPTEDRAFT_194446 [Capitella teleta]